MQVSQSCRVPLYCLSSHLISLCCSYWGIQGKVEALLAGGMQQVTTMVHKTSFALTDRWFPMDLEEVRGGGEGEG